MHQEKDDLGGGIVQAQFGYSTLASTLCGTT
jgi:hypothetical protein